MKHFDNQFTLNGQQRGFRVSGKNLLPRDASECHYGKSIKERRRAIAAERVVHERQDRAHMENFGLAPSRTEAQVVRTRHALSTRRAAYVERFFYNMVTGDDQDVMYQAAFLSLGNAQWRYFSALHDDWQCQMMQDADDQLLSYARG